MLNTFILLWLLTNSAFSIAILAFEIIQRMEMQKRERYVLSACADLKTLFSIIMLRKPTPIAESGGCL